MMANMASVVSLRAPGTLELQAQPLPPVGADDLLCETIVTAISPGTELAAYRGLPPLRPGPVYPRLQGYCCVGKVLMVGSGVSGFVLGDRILSFTSHRSHFVLPADDALVRLPPQITSEDAACAYLFHLGYNAVLRSGVRAGSNVAVIGLGALGLTAVAMAVRAGATVMAVSDHASPSAIASEFGAMRLLSRQEASTCEALVDVVISTTNSWADWQLALQLAAPMGTLAVLGFPGRGEPGPVSNPLDSKHFYLKQLRIEAVGYSPERSDARGFNRFNERANLSFLIGEIVAGRLHPARLVSGEYPGAQIAEAYEALLARKDNAITYLLRWART